MFGGSQPQLGWITDTMTGGTFFQSTAPGSFSSARLNLGDQGPDEAYNGRLALDGAGSNPVAEFQDLSDHIYIREYDGVGDIDSSSSWSVAVIEAAGDLAPGSGPKRSLAALPEGVRRAVIRPAHRARSAVRCTVAEVTPDTNFDHANYAIAQDAAGQPDRRLVQLLDRRALCAELRGRRPLVGPSGSGPVRA